MRVTIDLTDEEAVAVRDWHSRWPRHPRVPPRARRPDRRHCARRARRPAVGLVGRPTEYSGVYTADELAPLEQAEAGMTSGRSAVVMRLGMPDGAEVVVEWSLAAFVAAARAAEAFAGTWGES